MAHYNTYLCVSPAVRAIPLDISVLFIQDYLKPLSINESKTMIQQIKIITNYNFMQFVSIYANMVVAL